jgi:hypothetical protein
MLSKFLDFIYFVLLKFAKMIIKRQIFIFLLVCHCIVGASVTSRDSVNLDDSIMMDLDPEPEIILSEFSNNLDSLLNLWYVANARDTGYLVSYDPLADTIFPVYPDSFYIDKFLFNESFEQLIRNLNYFI